MTTDEERVHFRDQVLDHLELVGYLGPAEDRDEGAIRMLEHAPEVLDFLAHQQAGRGLLHVMDDAFGRGVGTVSRSERVVHVNIRKRGELLRKARVVLFFLGVEPEVLEEDDPAFAGGLDRRPRRLADTVLCELHLPPTEQLRQPFGGRP